MHIKKPWGYEHLISEDGNYKTKIITIKPQQQISLQYHKLRNEYWLIMQGQADISIDNKLVKNTNYFIEIPKKTKHHIHNISDIDFIMLEIQEGVNSDDDIIRLSDIYGRS